ncbi:MAG: HAD-IIIC family phosphatase [Bacteroidales bacterium]|nr:HAD-IIIC family phosphatase [Bacteroidales bacterium]MDD4670752.1 HAD-IIIC family phosphatase [Bacteroidales bacterium]
MIEFLQLKKNLKKDFGKYKQIKLSILGDSATQFLTQAVRGYGYEVGLNIEIRESDYNQIDSQILNPGSELYQYNPDYTLIYISSHKLLQLYNNTKVEERSMFVMKQADYIDNLISTLQSNIFSKIIIYNFNEINDYVFGNYSTITESSFIFQLRRLNMMLMENISKRKGCYIGDISSIQNNLGKKTFFSTSTYINADMLISIEALPFVAKCTVDIICAAQGMLKKCIILDLDNTLWGGIIGDDGIEKIQIGHLGIGKAFTEFQHWIKKLKERGIIVAICSKNTEEIAKEPFISHPDMVLRMEDIAVFVANWNNKADNIRYIQRILNIGFDSMVFLDDNPFERNIVRANIPEICVPELPEDPSDYLEYLYELNLFETVSHSAEDGERTKQYQVEAQRVQNRDKFTNEDDYLASLEMVSQVAPFNQYNIPRVAQLSQRSNQFNLTTIRYSESDIEKISQSREYVPFTFTLDDKYGDNGLIAVVILKTVNTDELYIETWIMSCRVLKRGMENFVLNTIMAYASSHKYKVVTGKYIPTAKNGLVKDHYKELGFVEKDGLWSLETKNYINRKCYINQNYYDRCRNYFKGNK